MEQVNSKKTKIAVICGFSNPEVRRHLSIRYNRPFFRFLIKLFHLPDRVGQISDHAPWIGNMITEFEKCQDIEIHIICSHISLRKKIQEYESNGVYYHFYRAELSSLLRKIDNLKVWKFLQSDSRLVNRLLRRIQPDLVNVVGIENPTTAIPALTIKKYPVFALSQTIYSNPERLKYGKPKHINWDLELALHHKLKYFGVFSRMHYDILVAHNPDAYIFDYQFPSSKMPEVDECGKEFDFVNFALQLDDRKGVFDSLRALVIVKAIYPDVKLNLIGRCDATNRTMINNLIEQYGLTDNVVMTPFFERQADMFQHLQKSRFAVLPCKLDVTSGTMSQAMYYGLPLVVYKTTGTPSFNLQKECVLIAPINDVDALANHMITLLNNPSKAEILKQNARDYMLKKMDNANIISRLLSDYRAVIDNYYNEKPIPKELLFDIERFPKYE